MDSSYFSKLSFVLFSDAVEWNDALEIIAILFFITLTNKLSAINARFEQMLHREIPGVR